MHRNPITLHAQPKLSPEQARTLMATAQRLSGVSISADKVAFVELRVSRRLREIGCPDFESYIQMLRGPQGEAEARCVAEALTTHTTSFFRERAHFDWLESEGLPLLLENGAGHEHKLTIWSAACSLGSEMWTSAIILDRFAAAQPGGLSWEVVGTDVSRRILRRASNAVFTEDEISGLTDEMRRMYLMRARDGSKLYRVVPELRSRARLTWANLVDMDRSLNITANVVFLRNVLIYFTPEDQRRAVANVVSKLRPGGYLMTGHSESLGEPPAGLRAIGASIYQKV